MTKTTTENIEIRRLRLHEIPTFANLRNEISNEAEHVIAKRGERKKEFGIRILAMMLLSERRTHTFLAWQKGVAVGYLSLTFAKFRKFRGNAYLTIAVLAASRSKGIGSKLMDIAETFAKMHGKRRMELEVFGRNTRAIELYKRRGYVIEGVKKNAVEDAHGYDDVIIMTKAL